MLLAGCNDSTYPQQDKSQTQPVETTAQVTLTREADVVPRIPTLTAKPTSIASLQPIRTATPTTPSQPNSRIITPKNLLQLTPFHNLNQESGVTSVAFSPDGTLLAAGLQDGRVKLWQVSNGKLLFTLEGHAGTVHSLAFSPDGKILASGSDDNTVRFWTALDGTLSREINTFMVGRALKVAFSKDGSLVATAGHLCYILLSNASTGMTRRILKQPSCLVKAGGSVEYWGLVFSPDGSSLITGEGQPRGTGGSIQVWDYEEYSPPQLVKGYDLVIRDFDLSPDGSILAVAFVGDSEIWLLQTQNGQTFRKLTGHTYRVNDVHYSPNGLLLASAGRDATVRLWDPNTGEILSTLEDHSEAVNSLAFTSNGDLIASGSDDGFVIVWGLSQP